MLKWLSGGGANAADGHLAPNKHSVSTQSLSALDEPQALMEALKAMDLMMDDHIEAAEKELEKGHSSYHKLASGVVAFLRASLGFEKDVMQEASDRLAEAEAAAERDRKRAVKENHTHGRLPPGLEYQVCLAEAQLMSAVVGLLSESVMETMKAFYRLRTAYKSLEAIYAVIGHLDVDEEERPRTAASTVSVAPSKKSHKSGHHLRDKVRQSLDKARSGASSSAGSDDADEGTPLEMAVVSRTMTQINRNVLENFATSGCLLCFGLLQLLLGLVPPSLARIMSIVGFRGDRVKGLELLWKASKASNVHGAIATMTILQYYGNTVQFSDITPADTTLEDIQANCKKALHRVRNRYNSSPLWILEEARMEFVYGSVEKAVDILGGQYRCEMKQIEALMLFEKCINSMFLHQYETVAEDFLRLTTMNKWSHGLYTYFSACCAIELYRLYKDSDPELAAKHSDRAEELLNRIPTYMGKKRFMAQSLPLETFADRKLKKWQARATAKGVRLVDGAGVSPIEEMIYVWNGYKRMDTANFESSLRALRFGEADEHEPDEIALRNFLISCILRRMGKVDEADALLDTVINIQKVDLKGQYHDEWMVPASHYEKGVAIWMKNGHGPTNEDVKAWLNKAASWGPYELDTRIGLKIQTAMNGVSPVTF
ncbi:hypothetical protein EX30DRAFT_336129 [Ascodesmis nigricans]|uniref:Inclusion body clearance protein IML2 n=1 Tax=Ascodesmis nigricans TaxID=341454 RepID=A0A4S2MQQ5_9PEZI|nr:hypothetical protein EX30DRAFT_336129 [Ascodesmis nigricans]